ncbi:hypothetical protein [Streptomyces sp. NPDC058861]|uniref:hypothetical protein n=1 Tax=Streptomyces sp. NPDC058861 TaxID=3346653 RepID=UPI003692C63C
MTALVSLPTAGRSTLALNVALHNAQQHIGALFTSGEITSKALAQKVIAARYGFDVRSQVLPGGWETFKATAVPERDATPLLRHSARVGTSARDSLRAGLLAAARRGFTLSLWPPPPPRPFWDWRPWACCYGVQKQARPCDLTLGIKRGRFGSDGEGDLSGP